MRRSETLINLTARQLHAFLEISRLQSFARAAESIHLSPSGISMLVKELEGQVGARLFDRARRAVTLTEAGRRLHPIAERIVHELRLVGPALQGSDTVMRQRLQIAAAPMLSSSVIANAVQAFVQSHPQVVVDIADVDVSEARRRALEGEIDLGVGFFAKPTPGLIRQALGKFRLMHISRPEAPRAGGVHPSQPWRSLSSLPLVSLPLDNAIQGIIEKQLARTVQVHNDRLRVNLISTIIAMVRAGRGDAIIPSFAIDECLRQGLAVSMLRDPVVRIDLNLVWQRGRQPTPIAMAFAAALQSAASGMAH